jgi:hypothetical protein
MNNIHLHSHSKLGILKGDIDDYSVVSSILPSEIFKDEPHETILSVHKISTEPPNRLGELLELLEQNSWTCKAEKNYYWTFGG